MAPLSSRQFTLGNQVVFSTIILSLICASVTERGPRHSIVRLETPALSGRGKHFEGNFLADHSRGRRQLMDEKTQRLSPSHAVDKGRFLSCGREFQSQQFVLEDCIKSNIHMEELDYNSSRKVDILNIPQGGKTILIVMKKLARIYTIHTDKIRRSGESPRRGMARRTSHSSRALTRIPNLSPLAL